MLRGQERERQTKDNFIQAIASKGGQRDTKQHRDCGRLCDKGPWTCKSHTWKLKRNLREGYFIVIMKHFIIIVKHSFEDKKHLKVVFWREYLHNEWWCHYPISYLRDKPLDNDVNICDGLLGKGLCKESGAGKSNNHGCVAGDKTEEEEEIPNLGMRRGERGDRIGGQEGEESKSWERRR